MDNNTEKELDLIANEEWLETIKMLEEDKLKEEFEGVLDRIRIFWGG
mgnify:CR=1 FL=1